jgi:hypothetical protein
MTFLNYLEYKKLIEMETIFDSITVNYSEYEYYNKLVDSEKINFLLQLFDQAFMVTNGIDLSGFFSSLNKEVLDEIVEENADIEHVYESKDYADDPNRVDVLIDEDNIMIESNSLKAVKHIIYKFAESGYILRRDFESEKMFKRDKITKYLRIFYVIDQVPSICTN